MPSQHMNNVMRFLFDFIEIIHSPHVEYEDDNEENNDDKNDNDDDYIKS